MSYTRPPSTQPGNETLDVSFITSQFSTINANDISADKTISKNLNVNSVTSSVTIPGKKVYQLVAYAPKAWETKTNGTGDFLNVFPDQLKALHPDGTTGDPNKKVELATLPVGAQVINARLTNNGSPIAVNGSPTYVVVIQQFMDPPVDAGTKIFDLVNPLLINNPGGVVVKSNAAIAELGSAGLPQNGTAAVVEGAQNIGVLLQGGGDNQAGDLALFLEYIL